MEHETGAELPYPTQIPLFQALSSLLVLLFDGIGLCYRGVSARSVRLLASVSGRPLQRRFPVACHAIGYDGGVALIRWNDQDECLGSAGISTSQTQALAA